MVNTTIAYSDPSIVFRIEDSFTVHKYSKGYYYKLNGLTKWIQTIEFNIGLLQELNDNPFKFLKDPYWSDLSRFLIKENIKVNKLVDFYIDLFNGETKYDWYGI